MRWKFNFLTIHFLVIKAIWNSRHIWIWKWSRPMCSIIRKIFHGMYWGWSDSKYMTDHFSFISYIKQTDLTLKNLAWKVAPYCRPIYQARSFSKNFQRFGRLWHKDLPDGKETWHIMQILLMQIFTISALENLFEKLAENNPDNSAKTNREKSHVHQWTQDRLLLINSTVWFIGRSL